MDVFHISQSVPLQCESNLTLALGVRHFYAKGDDKNYALDLAAASNAPQNLPRLSIGLEHPDDLIEDLLQ